MDFAVAAATLGFLGLIGLVTGALAARKGYKFIAWFFTGIIGLIVLCFLPFANAAEISVAEQRDRAERGNIIGRNISLVMMAITCLRLIAD